jgi:tRNA(Arg) A34 adenosine deaminase TadA
MQRQEAYMDAAMRVAQESRQNGGVAIGAVLVDANGVIIASGASTVALMHDPTAHAEVNCIRQAARDRESDDLYGTALYSTLEPCHMCLSAAAWARIGLVYFGAYRKDVDESLFDILGDFNDEAEAARMNLRENEAMRVVGGVREKECGALLKSYRDLPRHTA